MNIKDWESTIHQIVEESIHKRTECGKYRIVTVWRAKLEKAPTLLRPFQIDEIVREVRRRLTAESHRPTANATKRRQNSLNSCVIIVGAEEGDAHRESPAQCPSASDLARLAQNSSA